MSTVPDGITDIHCHILPGLDDGSRDWEETLQALAEAQRQGITDMIMTPHYYPERFEPQPEEIMRILEETRRRCEEQGIGVRLYPGEECMYHGDLVRRLRDGGVLTLAGSRYLLVEFFPDCPYRYLYQGLSELSACGYVPVLAHFERYDCLFRENHLRELKAEGFRLQMNFDMLLPKDGFFRRNPWRAMLRDGVVDFLGSDCHGTHFRPLRVREAVAWIDGHVEDRLKERLLGGSARSILALGAGKDETAGKRKTHQ